MTAHWVVLAAVALTTLVAAVVGAALAAFAGQALPHAVRHELTTASGTSIAATAPVSGSGAAAQATATLRTAIGAALPGIPFAFWQASWSDPLGFAPGTLRSRPAAAPAGSTLLLTAAALQDVRERATLVAGQWPGEPATPDRRARGSRSRRRCRPPPPRCCTCRSETCSGCRTGSRTRR